MRWTLLILVAAVLLGLHQAVQTSLAVGPITPSFAIPLVVFVALFAPPLAAMWTALLIGLVIDLASPRGATGLVVAGPAALGYLVAVYFVLTIRGLMYRRNPLTLAVMSMLACLLAEIVVVAVHSIRMMYTDAYVFRGLTELGNRFLGSLYTGLAGLALSFVLFPMMPLFGFHDPRERRFGARK